MTIAIISASIRKGRASHRVALFFKQYIETNNLAAADLIDLNEYQFPLFDERIRFMEDPSPQVLDFAARVKAADGLIIVTPEYNGGYPASLKNVIDLLYAEWKRKPVGLATVSDGQFGGTQVMTSLVFTLWKIGFWLVPAMYPVPKVLDAYREDGTPTDREKTEQRAKAFVGELLWCMEAGRLMGSRE